MKNAKLFDAEYRFMNLLWEHEPINSTKLVKLCFKEFGWKKSTTYSMIKRLSERSIVKNINTIVSTIVKRKKVQKYESQAILEKAFDGSLPSFITSYLNNRKLSKADAEQIIAMIKEASK
jgi:BlaI family penicillinase repressor